MNKIFYYPKRLKDFFFNNTDFSFLWLSQLFTQSAVSIANIIITILSDEGVLSSSTKNSSTGIGLILFFAMIPGLLAGLIAGVLADWYRKKNILIASNFLRFLLILIFVFFRGWENQVLSYAFVFLLSFVLQFFIPAAGGLIIASVRKRYLLFANSLFSLTVYTTLIVGLAFGGLFLNIFDIGGTFLFCALLFLISSILLFLVKIDEKQVTKRPFLGILSFASKLLLDAKNGIMYAFRNKILRFVLIHLFLLQIASMTLATLVYRIGDEIYGVSPRTAGIIVFSPLILGLLVGLAILNTIGKTKNRIVLIWWGLIISILGFSLMTIIAYSDGFLERFYINRILSSMSLMAIGATLPFLLVPAQTLIYEKTKQRFRGRVLGIWVALTSSLAAIVASLMGFVTDRIGNINFAIMVLVLADILYCLVVFYVFKKTKI